MDYHLLDENHIEILAGDIARGLWTYSKGNISRDGEGSVPLEKNTKTLNLRKTQKVSNLDTMTDLPASNLVGMALGAVLGPFGGLASKAVGLATGTLDYVCIGCELVDGRKFIARMRSSVYKRWDEYSEHKAK
jgi:hypothetical protein